MKIAGGDFHEVESEKWDCTAERGGQSDIANKTAAQKNLLPFCSTGAGSVANCNKYGTNELN
jgi:hypothetical protein